MIPELRRVIYQMDTGRLPGKSVVQVVESQPRVVFAAGLAVLGNPFVNRRDDEVLQALADASQMVGEIVCPRLVELLGAPVTRYGKGAIAGSHGCLEQLGALLHPKLGKPMRAAIGGGKAVIPSTQKIGALGASLDVPVAHKDDPWSFTAISTLTLSLADAPVDDEFVLAIVMAVDAF